MNLRVLYLIAKKEIVSLLFYFTYPLKRHRALEVREHRKPCGPLLCLRGTKSPLTFRTSLSRCELLSNHIPFARFVGLSLFRRYRLRNMLLDLVAPALLIIV